MPIAAALWNVSFRLVITLLRARISTTVWAGSRLCHKEN